MQDTDPIYSPITKELTTEVFRGEGTFQFGDKHMQSSFQITSTATQAYISFQAPLRYFREMEGVRFSGKLQNGMICDGYLSGCFNQVDSLVVANCSELSIGKLETIHTIETVLLGVYFPHNFSFKYKDYEIGFSKSGNSDVIAKRTKRISSTVLEGNVVTISGNDLNIEIINDLLADICLLLRPLTASEVYFGYLKCNNQTLLYLKKRMIGRLFGMRSNILESTHQYPDYLCKGLNKLETIDEFDRISIVDIGHALSTSAACGLIETGLMILIPALERLGQKELNESYNPNDASQFRTNLRQFRNFINKQALIYFNEYPNSFSEMQKDAIGKSISRIQPWDTAFVKKIQTQLIQNGWTVELDFSKVKELRDSLAHSGMLPIGFSQTSAYELQEQVENFLFVHILDLVGFDGRISSFKDGWAVFPWKNEFKAGKNE
jgi:hypothetical protein